MKVIVIGGNAAGMSAAARLARKAGDKVTVVVYEQGTVLSYGACGFPYYIGGYSDDPNLLIARTAREFAAQGIQIHLNHTVEGMDPATHAIWGRHTETGRPFRDEADVLVVASGAAPVRPPLPGTEREGVYFLKTPADAQAIRQALRRSGVETVAIVGGGPIGLELCDACLQLGKTVQLWEGAPRLLGGFAPEASAAVAKTLEQHGVVVRTGARITEFTGARQVDGLVSGGETHPVDLVLVAVGMRPATGFVPDSITKLPGGAIVTDRFMQTGARGVYAAGDCSTVVHRLTGQPAYLPLGTNANKQGRLLADNILGIPAPFDRALGTTMLRCRELELAKTGLSQPEAQAAGLRAESRTITAMSHAGIYPNPVPIHITVCYEPGSKKLLGAQLYGAGESAWRINVFACAIDQGMTAEELGFLDLGYAPPFASVWDAISRAANAIK